MAWSEVEQKAVSWWMSKRPVVWDATMHLQNPAVNTTTEAEAQLAEAVCELVKK